MILHIKTKNMGFSNFIVMKNIICGYMKPVEYIFYILYLK